jgi:hypothetical protein
MLDRIANPFRALRERLAGGIKAAEMPLAPQLVASVTDPVLVGQTYRNLLVAIAIANTPQPLSERPRIVRDLLVVAGPKVDGVTVNVGTVWLGESNVQLANATPLIPTAWLSQGPCDLAEVFISGATVGDAVRLRFAE